MRTLAALVLIVSLIAIPFVTPVFGGQFEDAKAAYERGDYEMAYRLVKPLADQGEAEAQFSLGVLYYEGKGVPQDYVEAVNWCRKAAEQGHWKAQYQLAESYYKGEGVHRDYVLAYFWVSLAVISTKDESTDIVNRIVEARDTAAKKLTLHQLAKVEQMVKEWEPKKEGK